MNIGICVNIVLLEYVLATVVDFTKRSKVKCDYHDKLFFSPIEYII